MKPIESLPPLGQHIRKYRKANRWTLSAFAAEHGMSKAYLWELENGAMTNPTIETLTKVAKATGTTLARVATLAAAGLPWMRFNTRVNASREAASR
jgi:transcriptional regulator with XRE-family HTH domain